ncbi:mechanosensitive ion channel family protein [Halorubrum sp. AD140]|uniref:mechanosensitive ion channel family protein n=1 Tax=Halorubrum sp. AD140 TaxID=3050073 RepID=UPI002ACC5B76|nr:mechanosensitive ion channel family protein [Halorubrum sp. AD140]MDZ5810296.1 mechanosensitive ion channel family protein [Halorubrum sp. AD140]
MTNHVQSLGATGLRVVTFVAVASGIYLTARFVFEPLLTVVLDRGGVEITLRRTIEQVVHVGVLLLGLYAALTLSGFGESINITGPFLAAVTLAVGFAARDVVNNLVSGVFIIADPRFKIGDWIEWNDTTGVIDDITFRTTRVRTFDNEIVSVPNSELATSAVTNSVEENRLRITSEFWISYDDEVTAATTILREEAKALEEILDRPAPTAGVMEVNDSRVRIQSRIWIGDPSRRDFVRIRSLYLSRVKERFQEEDVRMPPAW